MADQTQDNSGPGALREQVEQLGRALAEAKKELAITKSGLSPESSKFTKLFLDNYKGEWDTASLLEAAAEYDLKPGVPAAQTQEGDGTQQNSNVSPEFEEAFKSHFRTSDGAGANESKPPPKWASAKTKEEMLALYDGPMAW